MRAVGLGFGFRFLFLFCVRAIYFEFRGSGVAVLGVVGVGSDVVTTWEGRTSDLGGNPSERGGNTDDIK